MAIQTGPFLFTGKLGDAIGYKNGDKFCLRSAPQHVHQRPATMLAARMFGKASVLSAAMRHAVKGLLDLPANGASVNHLNKALLAVIKADDLHRHKRFTPANFKSFAGFSLNPHADLQQVLPVTPVAERDIQGNIVVTIPAMQDYKGHPQATHLHVKALAVHVQPGFAAATATASEPVFISTEEPAGAQTLVVPAGSGILSCVMVEVVPLMEVAGRFYQLHDRQHTATGVIAVLRGRVRKMKRSRVRLQWRREAIPAMPGPSQTGFPQRE